MDSQQILCFKTAARYENITEAAEKLFMPQPTVSKQIRSLEDEVGFKFFDRRGRHIYLNENGKIFLKYVDEWANLLIDCKKELQDKNSSENKSVTLLVLSCSIFIDDILIKFRKAHPDIQIKIEQSIGYTREEDLCIFSKADDIDNPCCQELLVEDVCLCVPDGDPLYDLKTAKIEDLRGRDFIMLKPDHPLRKIVDNYFNTKNFKPHIIMEVGNPIILRKLIRTGFGLSIAPTITWQSKKSLNSRLVPFDGAELKRHVYISWNNRKYLSKSARILRDFLRDYFENMKIERGID